MKKFNAELAQQIINEKAEAAEIAAFEREQEGLWEEFEQLHPAKQLRIKYGR
ncbi:hypothetical protein AB4571_01980 [Vibrio breoganii]|uniref:hypothetical protein n=1 Tax=Vibrio breoganii TaxID=553239 RepID=UPI0012FFDDC9|nr:hypothetical protein [Vibrio breoganii]